MGSFNTGTGAAGTTVTITPGFETKALIMWWNGRTESTDAGGSGNLMHGMGFATSASAFRCWTTADIDAAGTSQSKNAYRTDACILEVGASALNGWADVQSINATQVVFEILDAFSFSFRVCYLALGGSDITAAELGQFTAAGVAPVNQVVNTTSQGKLIFFSGGLATAAASLAGWASSFLGVATSSTQERVIATRIQDAAASGNTASYCRSGECIVEIAATDVCSDRAEFVSFNATPSFTINWLERTNARHIHYLQLSGTFQVDIGDLVTLATTGTITETGLAFQPTAVMLASACRAESTADVATVHSELSLGAATSSSNELVMQSSSRDGNTTMFTQTFVEYDAIYNNVDPTTDAIEGKADFTGFTSDGFTLNMSDADPVASFAWYVALASAAVVPLSWRSQFADRILTRHEVTSYGHQPGRST